MIVSAPQLATQPTVQPAHPGEDPDVKAVKETIAERYRNAYQLMDIDALKKVWPTIPRNKESSLSTAFKAKDVKALNVQLNCQEPSLHGDTAEYSCDQIFTWKFENAKQPPQRFPVVFQLKKNNGIWYIQDVRNK